MDSGRIEHDVVIREMRLDEKAVLPEFLYEAIFVPEGMEAPDRTIVEQPELSLYYEGFGDGPADRCIVAEVSGRIVGAVWSRIMRDYGHIDDETPSLAIALYKEYRGQGIGRRLMEEILGVLRDMGYNRVSLAVQTANYAVKLYTSVGFGIVDENEEEYIMVRELED